jgi:hypothetical protein
VIFEFISRKPLGIIDNLHLEAEHRKTIRKTELERSRSTFFAEKEEELIERARRDKEVQEIGDADLQRRLMMEIEMLRNERDQMSETIGNRTTQLSGIEVEILRAAVKSGKGIITRNEYIGGRNIQAGTFTFGGESPREFARYDAALNSLVSKGLVKSTGGKGQLFELTNGGWQIADAL